jgi:putative SOS response-associated peptidase YedK
VALVCNCGRLRAATVCISRNLAAVKKDGPNVDTETYAFLTTTTNKLVGTINHERIPVLLRREEEFDTWIRGSPDEAFALAREYPAERMHIVQEGLDKEDLLKAT